MLITPVPGVVSAWMFATRGSSRRGLRVGVNGKELVLTAAEECVREVWGFVAPGYVRRCSCKR